MQKSGWNLDEFVFPKDELSSLASKFLDQMPTISFSESELADLDFDIQNFDIQTFSFSEIILLVRLNVNNPYDFPLTINSINFNVYCSEHPEVEMGVGESSVVSLEPHSLNEIPITFTISSTGLTHIIENHLNIRIGFFTLEFTLDMSLEVKNIETEMSIYGVDVIVSFKEAVKIPLHYVYSIG